MGSIIENISLKSNKEIEVNFDSEVKSLFPL